MGGLAVLTFVIAIVALGATAGSVTAGDNIALFQFEPETTDVDPGETLEVDIYLRSHGEYGDTGVASIDLWLEYPAAYLTVVDVEPASWFEDAPDGDTYGDGPDDVEYSETVRTNEVGGVTSIEQSLRNPGDGGVIGYAQYATVTFEVDESASPATVVLAVNRSDVGLTSRYPQPVANVDTRIDIGGGGDRVEPDYASEPFADDASIVDPSDADDSTETNDADGTGDADESDDDATDTDDSSTGETDANGSESGGDDEPAGDGESDEATADDTVPGFGAVLSIVALGATVVALRRR